MRRLNSDQAGCLVLIGIGTLLFLLMLPAIQVIRRAQVRTACSNNLKHLLLAAHGYSDTRGGFPAGTVPNTNLSVDRRLSWHVSILPFIEGDHVHSRVMLANTWNSQTNREVLAVPFAPFRCANIDRDDPRPIATFVGLTGVGADSPRLPVHNLRAGVFGYDRGTHYRSITDGTSNTILVMEYGREYVPWAKGGEGTLAWFSDSPHAGPGRPLGLGHNEGPKYGLVGMADGAVRVIGRHVAPAALEAMATIAGGEPVVPE